MILKPEAGLSPISSLLGLGGGFRNGLLFLFTLAWDSRFRLPVLITVGFMILDIRMQLEINVDIEVRHVNANDRDEEEEEEDEELLSEDGSDSSIDSFHDADSVLDGVHTDIEQS